MRIFNLIIILVWIFNLILNIQLLQSSYAIIQFTIAVIVICLAEWQISLGYEYQDKLKIIIKEQEKKIVINEGFNSIRNQIELRDLTEKINKKYFNKKQKGPKSR